MLFGEDTKQDRGYEIINFYLTAPVVRSSVADIAEQSSALRVKQ